MLKVAVGKKIRNMRICILLLNLYMIMPNQLHGSTNKSFLGKYQELGLFGAIPSAVENFWVETEVFRFLKDVLFLLLECTWLNFMVYKSVLNCSNILMCIYVVYICMGIQTSECAYVYTNICI